MGYVVVGLSHKTASLDVREKLSVAPEKMKEALAQLLSTKEVQEGMLISTCNRVEAYLVTNHVERGIKIAQEFFRNGGGVSSEAVQKCLYEKKDEAAISHLFRVTASLDSMVVGEPQISGQVKTAYAAAVSNEATGPYLNKLVHRALHVAKKIRGETKIGEFPVSLSYAAVSLASKIFGNLKEKKVLIVGAGEMGELACRHLHERKVEKIYVANRSFDKASKLAKEFEGEVIDFEKAFLTDVDIVISSTASKDPILTESTVRKMIKKRKGRSMFLIDLGVPRDIEAQANNIENVYLYNVDDLQGIVTANQKSREKEARKAEGMIESEVVRFQKYLLEMKVAPTIKELSKKFNSIRDKELRRHFADYDNLPAKEKGALESCTKAIVNKILHDPILLMKTEEAKSGQKYSEILKKLFKLE